MTKQTTEPPKNFLGYAFFWTRLWLRINWQLFSERMLIAFFCNRLCLKLHLILPKLVSKITEKSNDIEEKVSYSLRTKQLLSLVEAYILW